MKKQIGAALLAALGMACVTVANAESYGDLIVGFTTESGNDHLLDLGSSANLTNGSSWNLSTLLTGVSLTAAHWGVIGNATIADSSQLPNISSTYNTLWTTTASQVPPVANQSLWNVFNVGLNSILQEFTNWPVQGNFLAIAATAENSWNEQTINGRLVTQIVNSYGNPNVVGLASDSLWQVTANSSAPVLLGRFSLNSSGVLTFNTSSAAPTAGFSGTPTTGTAPLKVVFTNTSTGTITNWLWTFGDGHSITNTSNANVTNTYAAAGNYTVSLKVTGTGGTNTLTKTNYIVASTATVSVPKISVVTFANGQLVISGTNGTASAEYRILSSTNLTLGTWTPVFTNNFPSNGAFGYTNKALTSGAAYFRVVSP